MLLFALIWLMLLMLLTRGVHGHTLTRTCRYFPLATGPALATGLALLLAEPEARCVPPCPPSLRGYCSYVVCLVPRCVLVDAPLFRPGRW